MEVLLRLLELDRGVVAHCATGQPGSSSPLFDVDGGDGTDFGSEMGISVVAQALRQVRTMLRVRVQWSYLLF